MAFAINGLGANNGFTYFDIKTSSDSKIFKNEELVGYLTNHGFEKWHNFPHERIKLLNLLKSKSFVL